MDISLLNPFAHAVPKSVDASISNANAACIAFNHSSAAPALIPTTPNVYASTNTGAGSASTSTGSGGSAPPSNSNNNNTEENSRIHSLFAGHYLAAGRLDGIVAIWDIETRSCLRWFDAHVKQVTSVAWSPHGRYLASSSLDWNVIVWDLGLKTGSAQPARKRTIRFDAPVLEVRFSPVSSLLLLAVLETQQAFIIDLRRPRYTLEQVPLPTPSQTSSAGQDDTAAGPSIKTEPLHHNESGDSDSIPPYPLPPDPMPALTLDPSTYSTAAFTPDGKFVFAGTTKGHLHVVDPQTAKTIAKLNATAPSGIRALAFDRTGSKLVINAVDRTIRTFLVDYDYGVLSSHGKSTWPFPAPPPINTRENHASDKAPVSDPNNMDILPDTDVDTDAQPSSNLHHPSPGAVVLMPVHKLIDLVNRTPWNGIGWSGDGGEYVYAGAAHKASHNIYIWDMATGTLEKVLQGPKDPLVDVDWHPTRPVIASACSTGAVHFWFSKSEEAWSAYAPQFEELEENVQYEEREEEFDLEDQDELSRRKQDEEEALVDISGTFAPALLPPGMPLLTGRRKGATRPQLKGEKVVEEVSVHGDSHREQKEDVEMDCGVGEEKEKRPEMAGGVEGDSVKRNEEETGDGAGQTEQGQERNGDGKSEEQSGGKHEEVDGGVGSEAKQTEEVEVNGHVETGEKQVAATTAEEEEEELNGDAEVAKEKSEMDQDGEGEKKEEKNVISSGDTKPEPVVAELPTTGEQEQGVVVQRPDSDEVEAHSHLKSRATFIWRWVRTGGGNGTSESFEPDDDVDPHFVIPVQLEDGNSSSDGSSRSD
ncbi:hypothetical protein A4X13_0g6834 [Tilletia indica]|uniref:Anaphase-promoting complex subunit 4 WD40 domain-containing protein n=1 Tax=Tilletia indica TaxID=43049 RepID=A0A177TM41_9BASI|nr:hypothetical protein A4X13_0g6834 [Tilletia indica]